MKPKTSALFLSAVAALAVAFEGTALAQDRVAPQLPPPAPANPDATPDAEPAPEALPPPGSSSDDVGPPRPGRGRRRRPGPRPGDPPPAVLSTESSAPVPPVTLPASSSQRDAAQEQPSGPPSARGLRVSLGARVGYVPSSGFDLYASNDVLASFSADATYGIVDAGRLTLAAGLGWDAAGRSSGARGLETSLATHRFTVPLEARYAFSRSLWLVGRVAPGAAYAHAEVDDRSAPDDLVATNWGFALDASVGPALVVGGKGPDKRGPRFIMMPEVGFMYTTPMALNPTPSRDAEDVIGVDGRTRLGDVALTGFFWRFTVGLAL